MKWLRRQYPFNADQTVNILGEFGPLMAMFIVNFAIDIEAGVWALIITTLLSMVVMYKVLHRLPVFPFIAGTITIAFGVATLITGDSTWVKIKVTVFNVVFALFLWFGLWTGRNFFHYILHQTFHYTPEGWRKFTHNFALFFLATAFANEFVRLGYSDDTWIMFKLFVVMPAAGVFAWWQSQLMTKYKIDPLPTAASLSAASTHPQSHEQVAPARPATDPQGTKDEAEQRAPNSFNRDSKIIQPKTPPPSRKRA